MAKAILKPCAWCGDLFKSGNQVNIACSVLCRFNAYQNKKGAADCWEWSGPLTGGYGVLCIGTKDGKTIRKTAHRFSYELTSGEIPEGLCVMHKCDNPKCTNPNHLMLGTHAENNTDRSVKGRSGKRIFSQEESDIYSQRYTGAGNPSCKLTESMVAEIKDDLLTRSGVLAQKFGVCRSTIKNIRRGVSWPHV